MAKTSHPSELDTAPQLQAPLDLSRAAGEQIFDAMKMAILRMELPPGTLISEAEIARRFNASRTPVREAFLQLREAGLVMTRPSRGNFVTKLSDKRILGARFVREAIELANVEHLCRAGMPDDMEGAIRDVLDQQGDAIAAGAQEQFQMLDDRFHILLAEATGFNRVRDLLEREKMVLDRLRVLALDDHAHLEQLLGEHRAIFEAVSTRNVSEARKQMRAHLQTVLVTLKALQEAHRDYFE